MRGEHGPHAAAATAGLEGLGRQPAAQGGDPTKAVGPARAYASANHLAVQFTYLQFTDLHPKDVVFVVYDIAHVHIGVLWCMFTK